MQTLFKRLAEPQLIEFISNKSEHKNVLILAGARQVGKTTLIQEIIRGKPHLYFNLEKNPSIAGEIDFCTEFADFDDYLRDRHRFDSGQMPVPPAKTARLSVRMPPATKRWPGSSPGWRSGS